MKYIGVACLKYLPVVYHCGPEKRQQHFTYAMYPAVTYTKDPRVKILDRVGYFDNNKYITQLGAQGLEALNRRAGEFSFMRFSLLLILFVFPLLLHAQSSQPTQSLPVNTPTSLPTSTPTVDPYDKLQTALIQKESPIQKAQIILDWLSEYPTHPRASEAREQILEYLKDLESLLITQQVYADEFLSEILAILDVKDPLARGEAAKNLALRGDSRAISPLIYALQDPSSPVRIEVVRSLGAFSDPRAQVALQDVLSSPKEDIAIRVEAANALGKQKTPSAARILLDTFRNPSEEYEVRQATLASIQNNFPDLLSPTEQILDRRGRWLLIPAAAAFGSYTLATVGSLGNNEAGITIGASGGLLLGGGSALLLSQQQEITVGQAAYITSGGIWGLGFGLATGAILQGDNFVQQNVNAQNILSLGVLGQTVGLGATLLTKNYKTFDQFDTLAINAGGAIGLTTGLGIAQFFSENENPGNALALSVALSATGLLSSALVAKNLRFQKGDIALTLLSAYEGAFLGNFLPLAFLDADPNLPPEEDLAERLSDGFFRIGLAQGALLGAVLSQVSNVAPSDLGEVFAIGSYGKLLGAGVPLVLGLPKGKATVASSLLGSTIGITSASLLADRLSFSAGDVSLATFGTLFGAFQGAAFAAGEENEDIRLGAVLSGASIGGLSAILLSQRSEISPWEVVSLGSGGFWGLWFSLFATSLDERPLAKDLPIIALFSDVGVLATAALLSPKISFSPTRIGISSLGGITGGALFSLGSSLFSGDNNDTIIIANLIGSTIGLGVGAYLSKYFDKKPLLSFQKKLRINSVPSFSFIPLKPISPNTPGGLAFGLRFSPPVQ